MTLSADAILAADDIVTEAVDCPEWGGTVHVKAMTGAERDSFEQSIRRNGEIDVTNARAKLLVRVLVNDTGTRIFSDKHAPDLGKKSSLVLSRLYEVAARLSGMSEEDEAAMEGNSETDETADGADSFSPSPATWE